MIGVSLYLMCAIVLFVTRSRGWHTPPGWALSCVLETLSMYTLYALEVPVFVKT